MFFIILISLVAFPSVCVEAGGASINICLYTIIPTLLPFFVVSNIMVSLKVLKGFTGRLSRITRRLTGLSGDICFVYVTASLSGYPMGAKLTSELYSTKQISKVEAERMALFSSVTGPAFMTVIATSLLNIPNAFIYIFLAHHIAMLCITFVYTVIFERPKALNVEQKIKSENMNFSIALNNAIFSSVKTLAIISCLVIFFYTLTAIIDKTGLVELLFDFIFKSDINNTPIKQIIFGFFEMTLGCIKTSESIIGFNQKIALSCGFLSFGGLSILFQAKTILEDTKIKTKGFFIYKLCHGLLAYLLCSLMLKVFPLKIPAAKIIYTTKAINYSYLYLPLIILVYLIIRHIRIRNSR